MKTIAMPKLGFNKKAGGIKISPRAQRLAGEQGIDIDSLTIIGTGWDGGISEQDLRDAIAAGTLADASSAVGSVFATPLAKKIAGVEGIDLGTISGTGTSGKITKSDVLGVDAASSSPNDVNDVSDDVGLGCNGAKKIAKVTPYAGIRKVIGERMAESKFTAPHLYFTQSVDMSGILDIRKQVNEAQEHKTSVTDFIAFAVVKTLVKFPDMNSSLIADKIETYESVNLGTAVAAPSGLIVPNVKDSQTLGLVEYSKAAKELVVKARDGKLTPADYTGGTFTISNLGMFGIEDFTAIINQPEIGILAVSATKDTPVVVTGNDGVKEIVIRPIMKITLTVDHRVLDGLAAAEFVTEVKRVMEHPLEILL